jgi:hypothetical protein
MWVPRDCGMGPSGLGMISGMHSSGECGVVDTTGIRFNQARNGAKDEITLRDRPE